MEVFEFSDEHNHPMIEENLRHFILSGRNLTTATKDILSSMVDAGIRTKKVVRYLQNEAGGIENARFIEQDAHNFIQARKRSMINSGDAQTLVDRFMHMQSEDSSFFYSFQVDEDGRMCNFFWRDSISKLHYECFGDVMIFDSTYRTNKYDMICAPFVGVNNLLKNIFFGCAFLSDETTSSFVWLFRTFLKAMRGISPKTIFTDQAPAIAAAIKEVFPDTCHHLCKWHIDRNAQKNIPQLYWKSGFREKYFDKLLWRCKSESEFELVWQKMIEEWDCGSNSWLQRLYDLREKWCPAFSRSIFFADIKSTQRSESTNRVFTEMACKTMSLTEFVNHYEQRAAEMRDIEATEDYKCRGTPKLAIDDCRLLKHAATLYTRTIFTRFQHEFLQGISKKVINTEINGTCHTYTILKGEGGQIETLQFNSMDNSISCSCLMFESLGWLCCHALKVLFIDLNFSYIPAQYILKRWTKNAKQGNGFEECSNKKKTSTSSMAIHLNGLMKESFTVMTLAANDADTSVGPSLGFNDQVLDPIKKKGNRNGYGRLKPRTEQKKRRAPQKTLKARATEQHEQQSLGLNFELYGDQNTSFTQLLTQASTNQIGGGIENQSSNITGKNVDFSGQAN
ncbi:PREDICTED: protein FAR1-RELATED SEQUENCE 5-like [Nicotiana attenuata]|uniref:protein FAR1-RELATED SEQUENCE 5-like n=1 Tax=Nicotiana attenuata TaxID=49451 RepID=UPI000905AFBF|nr:PREDICTED: protein FAR1-RELATED SEQUENCE 5-like [Nicotiana attenuata]